MSETPRLVLGQKFTEAFALALELHADQARKGDLRLPYMGHILGVTSIVIDDDGSEDEIIAALLHDGPEDADGKDTLALIEQKFGSRVATIVDALSDTFKKPKPDWKPRKEKYLKHLRDLEGDDQGKQVLRVSLADKLHNVRSIILDRYDVGEEVWERFNAPDKKNDTLWYYGELRDVYVETLGETALVKEYSAAVDILNS